MLESGSLADSDLRRVSQRRHLAWSDREAADQPSKLFGRESPLRRAALLPQCGEMPKKCQMSPQHIERQLFRTISRAMKFCRLSAALKGEDDVPEVAGGRVKRR